MIPVSKPFLPPIEEYNHLIEKLWQSKWLTNHGVYVRELEQKLQSYLQVPSLHFVSNGTVALQLALKALNIEGEVITTPFSFVATTTAIIWENCEPVFVDIDPNTLCIDVNTIEEAITEKTTAILATHVYGIPCDVERIEEIAKKYNLKVIYDAAHAFGVRYKGKSILNYGDLSILSFHATKLFHTVEGGGIINNNGDDIDSKIKLLRSFGFQKDTYEYAGINAKNSEFHAAMGLCNIKYVNDIIIEREKITEIYDNALKKIVKRPVIPNNITYNYAYYPIIFQTEKQLLQVKSELYQNGIESRRYFYPSLNNLPYLKANYPCQVSESISKRILCLPLYNGLVFQDIELIITQILEGIK